ncbi:hypothetical protein F2P56_011803 [Juglans regia]|uniref:Retrovirus-related Pol polyprotein from transposon TNT 1-94-like beta-barrel domain-containing protein n=1 Tax=Juglans regia TaxID=51240 RepID=A0A833XUK0_JUGRE|nr:hypothetical protein F2P56_011803 [Juglans regia]
MAHQASSSSTLSSVLGLSSDLYQKLLDLLNPKASSANFVGNVSSTLPFHRWRTWVVDSGASHHMCHDRNLFSQLTSPSHAQHVCLPTEVLRVCSAVFGTEIWPAAEYGRTMYTIRQRVGPLLMRMQKRYGKLEDVGELTEKEIIRAERNSGVISNRVREIQLQNALRKREQKERRAKDLREGLQLYKNAKYEEALEKFESVLGSKPDPDEASVASYNVACCYSKLNQLQAGLSALEDALRAGFEDFKRIRTDPDLAKIRTSQEFETLLKRFDESFINENAINAIKSLFGILNKN